MSGVFGAKSGVFGENLGGLRENLGFFDQNLGVLSGFVPFFLGGCSVSLVVVFLIFKSILG